MSIFDANLNDLYLKHYELISLISLVYQYITYINMYLYFILSLHVITYNFQV